MIRAKFVFILAALALIWAGAAVDLFADPHAAGEQWEAQSILVAPDRSPLEEYAARELRRLFYLRTGRLLPIQSFEDSQGSWSGAVVVAAARHKGMVDHGLATKSMIEAQAALPPESFAIQTRAINNQRVLTLIGKDDTGTLYAVYRLAEHMGVGFSLHGEAIPDQQIPPRLWPVDETFTPRVAIRGLLPFHDFPEGPDWWDRDDYLALVEQMPKLRLNFLGFHTYPEGEFGAEPTVWVGPKEDVLTSGVVKSAYPARYFTPLSGTWQYQPMRTSDYRFGVSEMFSRDDFGSEVMEGMTPWPPDDAAERELFRRTGLLFADVFQRANELGIKTCVGTELPLTVPRAVRARLGLPASGRVPPGAIKALYEGMFHRLQTLSPVDYYWFWSPESWLWGEVKADELAAVRGDLAIALEVLGRARSAIRPVISGWVPGPRQDPLFFHKTQPPGVVLAPLNRNLGHDPVDATLGQLGGRERWAITWLEDDGAMILPQLWAGRAARDVNDAIAYGCSGVIGLFWRTGAIAPTAKAFSEAMWEFKEQRGVFGEAMRGNDAAFNINHPGVDGRDGGFPGLYLGREITGTSDDYIYQSQWYDMTTYTLVLAPGVYTIRLHFAELLENYKPGDRVFDVALQGRLVLENLDLMKFAGPNASHIGEFHSVSITSAPLVISFVPKAGIPCLAAIEAIGPDTRAINCAGKTFRHFKSDQWPPTPSQRSNRYDDPSDFYWNWVKREFGFWNKIESSLVDKFISTDGGVARPANWTGGPGGLKPDFRLERYPNEGFPDLGQYSENIAGVGNHWRFNYWNVQIQHLSLMDRIAKQWGELESFLEKIKQRMISSEVGFNTQSENMKATIQLQSLINLCGEDMALLRRMARTKGDLGTIANIQQHSFPRIIDGSIARYTEIFGVPPALNLTPDISTSASIPLVVPTVRERLSPGKPLRLTVIAPGADGWSGVMRWRPMGRGDWQSVPIPHVNRAVHKLTWLPPVSLEDFEYYLEFRKVGSAPLRHPVTAPELNRTTIIF